MRIAAAVALSLAAASTTAAELIQRPDAIPGRYIVVLHEEAAPAIRAMDAAALHVRRLARARTIVARHGGRTEHVYERALDGYVATMTAAQVRSTLTDPRVRYIQQDGVRRVAPVRPGNAGLRMAATPGSWGLDRIDQRDLPMDGRYAVREAGRGVHAYIIDSGILASHREFRGRIAAGYSAVRDRNGTTDCDGHGTHVAGTVGGATYGVASAVTLYPVRVFDCNGQGTDSRTIAGVDWVTKNHFKPAVANMSLGGDLSVALDEAVRKSIAAGVTYAIAAGNEDTDACVTSPARVSQAITVGASNFMDRRSAFSNQGTCVDLFAPGEDIVSAAISGDDAAISLSGTSMAAPHVAGAAALILESTPTATPAEVARELMARATTNRITGAVGGTPNRLLHVGPAQSPSGDTAPLAAFVHACNARTCTFDASPSLDDRGITGHAWYFSDGTRDHGRTVTKTFPSDGTYVAELTVADTIGQTDRESLDLVVVAPDAGSPCSTCTPYRASFPGSFEKDRKERLEPNNSAFVAPAGTHRGWLQGPERTDFDLFLDQFVKNKWKTVAKSKSSKSNEAITYTGEAGIYRWRVVIAKGAGDYTFWMQRP